MIKLKTLLPAAALFLGTSTMAMAGECQIPGSYRLQFDNSTNNLYAIISDGSCTITYKMSGITINSIQVLEDSKYGDIKIIKPNIIKYTSQANYGKFTIKICGEFMGDKGCNTINYTLMPG